MVPLLAPRWRRHVRESLGASLDLVLPPMCPACGDACADLCARCASQLSRWPLHGCARCGAPMTPEGRCNAGHRPLRHVRQLVAALRFAGSGGALVRRFKLDASARAGVLLAREMADAWRVVGGAPRPLLVSVPLHRARRRRRGFDQAAWLASRLGDRLGLRVAVGALARVRATRPQGDARVLSRAANVRGAFSVCRRRARGLRGRDVLLVDDVWTTGATARACAAQLRAAGAASVSLLVACRS